MFGVLREIESEDRPRYAKERIDYEVAQARYETAKKQMIEHMQTPEALLDNTVIPSIPPEPAVPVATKLMVQDITSQKLVRQCADRPRGLLCYLDEMAAWAEKVSDTRSGEDRSAWTVAYESRWYEMDRVGAGTISASNFALSIFGNIQPQVMQMYAAQLSKDGLLQRFIPVVLRPKFTRLGHPVPECMTSKSAYDQVVRVVYGLPPVTYYLSPEALTIYREFQGWYEQAKHDERITGALPTYMTAFGKIEGLAGRVALVWHCIETPYSMQVSGALMTRVIKFVKDYVIPTLRYVHQPESGDSFDKWLADHVIFHCDIVSHTLADLKHSSRVQLKHLNTWQQDQAIIGGFAKLSGRRVMLIGHEKGNDTQSRLRHNFGMGKPEGYRKAVRLMEMAGRFGLPVVTLVDTSGAFPGVEAEERGQAEAIARSTEACLALGVPMVATIVGEGGSGGAVALASAERVLMFEHAVYSVISPEGCASILWRTSEKAADAAEAMKVTAQDLLALGVIDRIVPEPMGGAHRDPLAACASLGKVIAEELDALAGKSADELRRLRAERFLQIGG